MNDTQNNGASANSQLGAGTENSPQTATTSQNISDTAGNLQTVSTPNLFSGTPNVTITKVGDGNFVPYTPDNTTTTSSSVSVPKPPTNHHYPVIAGASILIVLIIVVMWLMSRKHKPY